MTRPLPILDLDDVARRCAAQDGAGPVALAVEAAVAGPIQDRARSWRGALLNLRLARRYHLKVLAADEIDVVDGAGAVPACDRCDGRCCRGPGTRVRLRLLDVARLIDAGLGDAIDPTPDDDDDRDSARLLPRLARTADDRCVFLTDAGRCAAWPIRPLACRGFPLLIEPREQIARWAGGCPPGDASDDSAALLDAAVLSYNVLVRDLLALAHGRALLPDDVRAALPERP